MRLVMISHVKWKQVVKLNYDNVYLVLCSHLFILYLLHILFELQCCNMDVHVEVNFLTHRTCPTQCPEFDKCLYISILVAANTRN